MGFLTLTSVFSERCSHAILSLVLPFLQAKSLFLDMLHVPVIFLSSILPIWNIFWRKIRLTWAFEVTRSTVRYARPMSRAYNHGKDAWPKLRRACEKELSPGNQDYSGSQAAHFPTAQQTSERSWPELAWRSSCSRRSSAEGLWGEWSTIFVT